MVTQETNPKVLEQLRQEVARRRTFAIISHPDAGKTTLTEKLLLYTGALELAGAVRARRNQRHATSDWMAMEQERGIREYPRHRGFLVACGLEDVLRYLEGLCFPSSAIDYLYHTGIFDHDFLGYLKGLRFTGAVWAIPEGRLFFANEPILEVTAPIIEAQIVETFIINQINLQSLLATKAARCVHAAQGRAVVDFSLRRVHGIDAGMKLARAGYIAGLAGTSNVLAGKVWAPAWGSPGMPPRPTWPTSWCATQDDRC